MPNRRSWLSVRVASRAEVGYRSLPMIPQAGQVVKELLDDESAQQRWLAEVWPALPKRLIKALSGCDWGQEDPALVLPGLNSLWQHLLLACGADSSKFYISLMQPGLEALVCAANQANMWSQEIICREDSGFMLEPEKVYDSSRVIVVAYPHHLSGTPMTHAGWCDLCEWAEKRNLRLVNYNRSVDRLRNYSLSEAAGNFPKLSWLEIFDPCATIGRDEGWSLAIVAGSPDFVADLAKARGLLSGAMFVPMMAGVLAAFEEFYGSIRDLVERQQQADFCLRENLLLTGLYPLNPVLGGYFSLWQVPKLVNGEKTDGDAAKFNQLVSDRYGLDGMPIKDLRGDMIAYTTAGLAHDGYSSRQELLNDVGRHMKVMYY